MNNIDYSFYKVVDLKNNRTLVIRNPVEADASNMFNYLNRIAGESDNLLFGKDSIEIKNLDQEEFIKKFNEEKNSLMLLGFIDNRLVSIGNIKAEEKERISHNSSVGISVLKDFWKMGIGSSIMNELIDFAKKNNITKIIHLGVKEENDNAVGLYKKLGFKEIGCNKNYFKIDNIFYNQILMDLYI